MNELILGIDLCDTYSQISTFSPAKNAPEPFLMGSEEESCLIPTVLCKMRGSDTWLIGSEAYRRALMGEGTMVDKLVKLLYKNGSATIEGVQYGAVDLMGHFIEQLLSLPRGKYGVEPVRCVAFGLKELNPDLLDRLTAACDLAGLSRDKIRFLSHTECFSYYVAAQPKELWPNMVVGFDLTDAGLDFFELRAIRGRRPQILEARREPLEEAFDLDILETPVGERMADTILSNCADRMLSKKLISSVFLTGEGFGSVNWAPEFIRKICNKRKVFGGQHLFSDGACLVAYDSTLEESSYPYICICEGRLASSISVYAVRDGKNEQLVLASAGSNWYEARVSAEFILDDVHSLDLLITPFSTQRVENIGISLAELPARPNKTTRVQLIVSFASENHVTVRVVDKGFGELFPATDMVIRKDFLIS
ncbi:MAG: hypothetical protein IKI82_06325 [Lachnospiraceae bacterium]|nr:hypothetical protein [Lachnospiraceae bacterium]